MPATFRKFPSFCVHPHSLAAAPATGKKKVYGKLRLGYRKPRYNYRSPFLNYYPPLFNYLFYIKILL